MASIHAVYSPPASLAKSQNTTIWFAGQNHILFNKHMFLGKANNVSKTNLIATKARRNLRHADQYLQVIDDATLKPAYLNDLQLRPGETLIGVYENHPRHRDKAIVITDKGLHFRVDDEWIFHDYLDMAEVRLPQNADKFSNSHVTIYGGNTTFDLPVMGISSEKFMDVYAFYRFLRGAIRSIKKFYG